MFLLYDKKTEYVFQINISIPLHFLEHMEWIAQTAHKVSDQYYEEYLFSVVSGVLLDQARTSAAAPAEPQQFVRK